MAVRAKERGGAEGEVKKKSKQSLHLKDIFSVYVHIKDKREGKRGNMREYR
jgi:hypothetical protein